MIKEIWKNCFKGIYMNALAPNTAQMYSENAYNYWCYSKVFPGNKMCCVKILSRIVLSHRKIVTQILMPLWYFCKQVLFKIQSLCTEKSLDNCGNEIHTQYHTKINGFEL